MDPMEILQDFPVPSQEVLLGLFLGHGLYLYLRLFLILQEKELG